MANAARSSSIVRKKAGVEASLETVNGKAHEELHAGNVFAMKFFKSGDK